MREWTERHILELIKRHSPSSQPAEENDVLFAGKSIFRLFGHESNKIKSNGEYISCGSLDFDETFPSPTDYQPYLNEIGDVVEGMDTQMTYLGAGIFFVGIRAHRDGGYTAGDTVCIFDYDNEWWAPRYDGVNQFPAPDTLAIAMSGADEKGWWEFTRLTARATQTYTTYPSDGNDNSFERRNPPVYNMRVAKDWASDDITVYFLYSTKTQLAKWIYPDGTTVGNLAIPTEDDREETDDE